jgi:P27 family predicted phage terminase small subunit
MGRRGPLPAATGEPLPLPAAKLPAAAPAPLSVEAAAEYARLAPLLPHVSATAASVLAVHCQAAAEIAACSEQLAREGLVLSSPTGTTYLNPAHAARASAHKVLLATATHLGLTPSSRARANIASEEQASGPSRFSSMHGNGPA